MIDNLDKSFLRLKTTFAEAKYELLQDSEFVYKENIIINPTKIYTQISNSKTSIAFDDSYIVELVDCNDNALLDITDKVYINEFQDHKGIYQLAFEIAPIGVDFYGERLFLRFTHLDSDLKAWSNPVLVSEHYKTFRLEYKNYNYYEGISYEIANIYQSIDLVGYIDMPSTKETTKIYTQLNGDIRNSRPIQAIEYAFNIDFIDSFTFTRLSSALNSELIYINGVRFIKSENVQSDGREGKANYFPTMFKGQFIETDTLDLGFQIRSPFLSIGYSPSGLYTLASIPVNGAAVFNHAISTAFDVKLWDYDTDTFIMDISTIFIATNNFDFFMPVLGLGNYYFTFEAIDTLNQVIKVTDKETWKFTISTGQYNKLQYKNNQYFTD
jgi:hypothetical protein